MIEDQLEQETLGWLTDAGYLQRYGLDIAPDGPAPERSNYHQVLLVGRLREAINRLNPLVPMVAREDALHQMLNLDTPVLLAANRVFHQLLVNGVPVEYQKDGETRGDFVRLIDFADVTANEWLAVNLLCGAGDA
jgi:type I restriction enzyme R subunit